MFVQLDHCSDRSCVLKRQADDVARLIPTAGESPTLSSAFTAFCKTVTSGENVRKQLEGTLQRSETICANRKMTNTSLEKENAVLQRKYGTLSNENTTLTTTNKSLLKEMAELRAALSVAQGRVAELEEMVESLEQRGNVEEEGDSKGSNTEEDEGIVYVVLEDSAQDQQGEIVKSIQLLFAG